MKNKKWILILSAVVCFVLAGIAIAVGVNNVHTHSVAEAREYHIGGDRVYYTQYCKCGEYDETTNIDLTEDEVFTSLTSQDKIVLDGNVCLNKAVKLTGFNQNLSEPEPLNTVVNIDLRGYSLTTSQDDSEEEVSLFDLNARYGKISLNIQNGKLNAGTLKYVFKFATSQGSVEAVKLQLSNVECYAEGDGSATIYASQDLINGKIVANNCKFLTTNSIGYNCFGVVIDSESEFEFNNCYFEGGDSVYIRRGNVVLNNCDLINKTLYERTGNIDGNVSLSNKISATGNCLTLDTNIDEEGACSKYNVKLNNCYFDANEGNGKVLIISCSTANNEDIRVDKNDDSVIEMEGCVFREVNIAEYTKFINNYTRTEHLVQQEKNLWQIN